MSLEAIIEHYGYFALILGTALEGETILVVAGYLAHRGYLQLPYVIAAAMFGTFVGDQTFFQLGRQSGEAYLARRSHRQARAARVRHLLECHRIALVMGFRFMYGIRTVAPFVIGMSGFSRKAFMLLNAVSAAIWAITIGCAGYAFGRALEKLFNEAKQYERPIVVGIVAVGATIWILQSPHVRNASAQAKQMWLRGTLKCVGFGLMISTLIGALHDVSRAWDVWYYHMPFAARLAGILPRELFTFDAGNEARFRGFPLLGELLQGWFWRITGRPETANLVAFSSVPVFGIFLRYRFGVPLYLSTLGLLAVPLVQLHMTSCYVDLPGNTAAAVLILLTLESYARSEPPTARALILAVFAAAFAANTKTLLHPVVLAALILLLLRAAVLHAGAGFFTIRARWLAALGAMLIALVLVYATPLKNIVVHGNPYYPLDFTALGHHFPGLEQPYESSPRWLASASRPVRFVASILELHSAPLADRQRWTVDQWTIPDAPGYRMGGFFGAYVVGQLIFFVYQLVRQRSRQARRVGGAFALLTVLTSALPQSHELRYYMYWIIVLISLNLWLGCEKSEGTLLGIMSAAALGIVLAVTHCGYVYPSGSSFKELVREKVHGLPFNQLVNGASLCVTRPPYELLWAAPFHPPYNYRVKSVELKSQCGDFRPVN